MKKYRIINALVWVAVAIVLTTYVCLQWAAQGCGWDSLIAAIVMNNCLPMLLCALVDDKIRRAAR